MGSLDGDKKFTGGSIVDGIKRKAPEPKDPEQTLHPTTDIWESEVPSAFGDDALLPSPRVRYPYLGGRVEERPRPPEHRMLGFQWDKYTSLWIANPQFDFKPKGLYIIGHLTTGARLSQAHIGMMSEVLCSADGIPAHFFSTAKSYAEIAKAWEDQDNLPNWVTWSTLRLGMRCLIRVEDRNGNSLGSDHIDLGMWGLALVP